MIFTCNNNYSEHIRHILHHTGVIWNFYGIFQQRISRSSIGLGQRDKYKRKEETETIGAAKKIRSEIRFQRNRKKGNMKIWGTHIGYVTTPHYKGLAQYH